MSGFGPPFDTAFYTVRVSVSTDLQDIVKTVSIMIVLRSSASGVRTCPCPASGPPSTPPSTPCAGVSCVVGVLLIAGTVYDVRLARAVKRRRRRAANITAHPRDLKLQINGLDDIAAASGKAMYNVNNNITINSNNSEERLTAETASTSTEGELKLSESKCFMLLLEPEDARSSTIEPFTTFLLRDKQLKALCRLFIDCRVLAYC
ncbi:TIGR00268 family protein [Operophtera brumata]|uniref:TIGR00268 family protein n=1 Tax=Operophtera brumata TaxID=104452 RepID=A0A0L7L2N5_OPEBR|nr:TIGR00268 family protein [Operophtera brumata]